MAVSLQKAKNQFSRQKILVSTTPILTSGNKLLHPFLTKAALAQLLFIMVTKIDFVVMATDKPAAPPYNKG